MLNELIRYFDLQSKQRQVSPKGHTASPHAPVLPQYIAVSLGVIVEPLLRQYIAHKNFENAFSALPHQVLFGLIVGIVLLPSVYKASFDPQRPISVQLAALFPLGIGWQSIFTAATAIQVQ